MNPLHRNFELFYDYIFILNIGINIFNLSVLKVFIGFNPSGVTHGIGATVLVGPGLNYAFK